MIPLYLLIVVLMLILSAFFSGTESAFNFSNSMHLRREAANGSLAAKTAYQISENFNQALCAILIGNNLANVAASACATSVFIHLFANVKGGDAIASVVSTAVLTIIVLIFSEIVPKILCKQHSKFIVKMVSIPLHILTIILYPIVFIVMAGIKLMQKLWGTDSEDAPDVTEDELSSIIDTVEREGVIDEESGDLLQSSLMFYETSVEEIMTPRIDLLTIDLEDSPENIKNIIDNSTYSRIPVYRDSIDKIVGILVLNHYYKEIADDLAVDINKILLTPCFLHKTMKLPAALKHLRERHLHMAIVIDEFGGTLGVVTVEDILEEIVGDIWDESDEIVSTITCVADNQYEVLGEMNIDDLFYELDFHPKEFECEYSTVGGWAIENLNSDPHVGDTFSFEHLDILVYEMEDGIRVTKLIITVGEKPKEEDETEE